VYRIVAWLAYDAPFATASIAIELVITSLLLFAASRIK